MAKKTSRQIITLRNPKTGTIYYTRKNTNNTKDKLVLKKYDKKSRKIETFKESKVKLG
jgi:large subunit ribosomal protein L33